MKPKNKILNEIIETSQRENVQTRDGLYGVTRRVIKRYGSRIPDTTELRASYDTLVKSGKARRTDTMDRLLTRREIRSLSGVAVITVLTKPYPCPGSCTYCPTEARMPKSYLSNEPAAMRALLHRFDPVKQVTARIRALENNGHPADKIELIVKGGTWSSYPWRYRKWFIKRCFDACNDYGRKVSGKTTLAEAQKKNETAAHRIIGMTLETRPDWVTVGEVVRLRELGCTRIELGVQSIDKKILERVRRGHGTAEVKRATRLLKDAGYKTDFHMMPQLPGATPSSDLKGLVGIFDDPDYRPDMLKVYPCTVIKDSALYLEWKRGDYRPYPNKALFKMLMKAKTHVPRYCRISRLIRDIPSTSVEAGNKVTNLRQVMHDRMAELGLVCQCLRCREVGRVAKKLPEIWAATTRLFDDVYQASEGEEHFLTVEDTRRQAVFAFCRLRLPSDKPSAEVSVMTEKMPEIKGAAFIRELHTYGHLVPISGRKKRAAQHKGLGKRLMNQAEEIARKAGYKKMAVISGVGVRDYYRKLGYRLQGTFMVKSL